MELALRRGYGYAFDYRRGMRGLGDGEYIDPETGLPVTFQTVTSNDPAVPITTDLQACAADPNCSLPPGTDPSLLYNAPGYNITGVTPGPVLTPDQLKAQQASAQAWLLQNVPVSPSGLTQAQQLASLALSASQIASGLTAGTVQRTVASACPSGYKYAAGPCVPSSGAGTGQLISGVSNSTLGIAAVGFLVLMMFSGGRRR